MNAITELSFRGAKRVRVFGTHEKPLFLAADVAEILEISKSRDAVARLPKTCTGAPVVVDGSLGPREMSTLTEAGAYRLIFTSRKPQAEEFMRWVTEEVLPSIRLHGRYEVEEQARRLAFQHFLTEVPSTWRHTFKDDWFEAILGVWGLDYVKARTPGFVGKVINEFVYDALVQGLPTELKSRRAECGKDASKLHQFLVVEAREKLSEHLAVTKALALNCQGKPDEFRESFDRVFRGRNQLLLALTGSRAKRRASFCSTPEEKAIVRNVVKVKWHSTPTLSGVTV